MENLKAIRTRLKLSQAGLGSVLGCTQANVAHYETGGQSLPADRAIRLVDHAVRHGLHITLDHVYDRAKLPPEQLAA